MQVEALALRLRPRTPYEAADLGSRLCQSAARDVYRCYAAVALPVFGLCLATIEISEWLPAVAMWWMKPWLDRTILFVLSRAAFGQRTSLSDLWRAQRQVWWSQFFLSLTWRRLSPWRSFTQPVYQLEDLPFGRLRKRVLQIRRKWGSSAMLMTGAYQTCETVLSLAVVSLLFWFAPRGEIQSFSELFAFGSSSYATVVFPVAAGLVIFFLEPFYVASGFALYLTRRAELEAWDIEQEFRRAFAQ